MALFVVAGLWAATMSWFYRFDFEAGRYTYLKVDFIAFYTAAAMVSDGNADQLYDFRTNKLEITVDRAAGVPAFAKRDLAMLRILPGKEFEKAAASTKFPGDQPPVYVYNPLYAVMFMPLLKLAWFRAALLFDFVCLFAFMTMLLFFLRRVAGHLDIARTTMSVAATVAVCTLAFPIRFDLLCGQVTPLVAAALLSANFSFRSPVLRATHGSVIALLAGMKVLPLLIIVWLVVARRRTEAIAALITTAILAMMALLVFSDAIGPWQTIAAAMNEGTRPWVYNQSVEAMLGRFLLPLNFAGGWDAFAPAQARVPATILVASCLASCCLVAWKVWKSGMGTVPLLMAMMALLSFATPLAWAHYGVYCLPAVVCMGFTTDGRRVIAFRVSAVVCALALIADPNSAGVIHRLLVDPAGHGVAAIATKLMFAVPTLVAVALFTVMLHDAYRRATAS
ncbi:DUF2029 domain-containing protein [Candidatus Sumerlaeota bacterium]|nr:DUF2029 domain-containing protein [Candidatus Sumerlaeota bacterium]